MTTFHKTKYQHIFKSASLLSVFVFCLQISAFASGYDYTPAIVQVGKSNQADSIGFNLVEQLNALFYKKIQDETVYLWDSPAKRIKIGKSALQMIEDQNNIRFQENDEIFIYEFWKLYNREFEFQITGFSFFRRTDDGNKLNLGYIDVADVKVMLSSLVIPTNANGQANLTYWSALMSKKYNFNLVKFGKKDLTANPGLSFNLKDQAFANPKVKTNAYQILQTKEIEYAILPLYDKNSNAYKICMSVENYFQENRQEYFNHTSNAAISHLDKKAVLSVTRIDVVELWRKDAKGNISYQTLRYKIFINEKAIDELSSFELEQFKIMVKFKPMDEFIREKDFKFSLRRVNEENIYGFKSELILTALQLEPWHKITYYSVK